MTDLIWFLVAHIMPANDRCSFQKQATVFMLVNFVMVVKLYFCLDIFKIRLSLNLMKMWTKDAGRAWHAGIFRKTPNPDVL